MARKTDSAILRLDGTLARVCGDAAALVRMLLRLSGGGPDLVRALKDLEMHVEAVGRIVGRGGSGVLDSRIDLLSESERLGVVLSSVLESVRDREVECEVIEGPPSAVGKTMATLDAAVVVISMNQLGGVSALLTSYVDCLALMAAVQSGGEDGGEDSGD